MKRVFTLLVFAFALMSLQAQFVDFGTGFSMQKGDFAVGDIDNDGDLDIIFSGEEDGPWHEVGAIMLNDGTGNFTPQTNERVIRIGRSGNIQFGDIDGDGDLDVIFCGWGSQNSSKGIALNNGSGVFTLADAALYPVNNAATVTSCGFADFNLDGLLDYYFFANGIGNCIIYFQQPDGSFEASTESFGTHKWIEPEVTVIDFDNDQYPDLFITCHSEDFTPSQKWSGLFKNDGYGVFTYFAGTDIGTINPNYYQGNGTTSWSDVNGDGYPDLLLNGDQPNGGAGDGNFRVFKNLTGMSFELKQEYTRLARQGGVGNGSLFVDWDNDGKLDFIMGGWNFVDSKQQTFLFLGDNPASFTFTKSNLSDTYFPGVSEQGFRVADLNNDGKVDLLMCGYSGNFPPANFNRRIAGYMVNQSENASVPPAAPTALNASIITDGGETMITFSWSAPESETGKRGTTYNLALKNTTTGKWFYNPMAVIGGEKNGWRKVSGRMGNVFYNTSYELYDLPDGVYEWTVQAINGAYLGGSFAEIQTFQIGNGSGINTVNYYKPNVYVLNKKLIVESASTETQSLKIYAANGTTFVSTSFTNNAEIDLPAGIYIVELVKADAAPFRTKVLVN